jgi:hypothetical protein
MLLHSYAVPYDRAAEISGWLDEYTNEYPCKNVIIYNTVWKAELLNGVNQEWKRKIARDGQGFGVYIFDTGTFKREGDGGWSNWVYHEGECRVLPNGTETDCRTFCRRIEEAVVVCDKTRC